MTPFAYSIVKETWLPLKRRRFADNQNIIARMSDVHCFEVSDVFELADDLGRKWHDASIGGDGRYVENKIDKHLAFLPAPKTWMEWVGDEPGERIGVLLHQCVKEGKGLALCTVCVSNSERFESIDNLVIALKDHDEFEVRLLENSALSRAVQTTMIHRLYALLAVINTPKIIGRRQHLPHAALERAASKGLGAGKFPLHVWTEIKLSVSKPIEIDDGDIHEAHLTGRRALHFCRAHIRIRNGRLEYVTSHWRGDAAIGIKQSRYKLTA